MSTGSRWLPSRRIAEVAVSETFRRPVQLVLALVVVLGLVAAGMVATTLVLGRGTTVAGAAATATVEIPPIDGDPTDSRDRHVVRLDAAAFGDSAVDGSDQDLVAPGRATSLDGGDTPGADLDGVSAGLASPAEEELADALAATDTRIDAVTAMGHGWYAVVSSGLGDGGLAALPGVTGVERDPLAMPAADPLFDQQWALENTGQTVEGLAGRDGADIGWSQVDAETSLEGDGVLVAVLDSGIDATIDPGLRHDEAEHAVTHDGHDDLPPLWVNAGDDCPDDTPGGDDDGNTFVNDCAGWDFVANDNTPFDTASDNQHGTAVAGVIAAQGGPTDGGVVGVAPAVDLLSLKIIDGGSFPSSRAAMAIDYAVAEGADIINASWTTAPGEGDSTPLRDAIDRAGAAGVLIVAAAGNTATNIDHAPVLPASHGGAHVISVGAADAADQVSQFSNYGPEHVDLFAPGTSLMTTLPGDTYGYRSGTSVAAPVVTGIAALVLQQLRATSPGARATDARDAVLASAVPDTVYAGLAATGGRVHAARALGLVDDPLPGALAMTFTSLTHTDGLATAVVDLEAGAAAIDRVDLTLAALDGEDVLAVADHLVRVKVVDAITSTRTGPGLAYRTGDSGALTLDELSSDEVAQLVGPTGLDMHVHAELPRGRYVLMAEAWDGATALTPTAVLFTLGDPGQDEGTTPDDGASAPPSSGGSDPSPDPTDDPTGDPVTTDPDDRFDTDPLPEPTDATTEPTPAPTGTETDAPGGGDGTPPTAEETESEDTMLEQPTGAAEDSTGDDTTEPPDDGTDDRAPICADFPADEHVTPNCGTLDGGEVVTLKGDFDDLTTAYVHFGAQAVGVDVMFESWIQVTAPARAEPGTVDLAVYRSAIGADLGEPVVTYPQAYTYYDPDAEQQGGGGDGGSSGDGDGGSTDDDDRGGDGGDDVVEPPFEPEPSHLDNGLTLMSLPDDHPLHRLRPSAWRTNGCQDGAGTCADVAVRP